MNKLIIFFVLSAFLTGCSLNKNSKFWTATQDIPDETNQNYKFVLTSKSMVYHFASRASRFPDDNLTTRPVNLAEIEQRSTQRFIEKYGRLPERDEHDFYIPLQIIDGTPNRINQ